MLEHMGVKVISEGGPFEVTIPGRLEPVWIHDFAMRTKDGAAVNLGKVRQAFQDSFLRVWEGRMEDDGFNRLVLRAGLGWREVTMLRAYAKYLRQIRIQFSQDYMEDTLADHAGITRLIVRLFQAMHDPAQARTNGVADDIQVTVNGLLVEIDHALDDVANLDEDRILRRFLNLVRSTLRTNYFQKGADGELKPYLSMKLDSRSVDELPLPRPMVEVWVYSPRVEGDPSARRQGGARRHPLVRPARGFPHRDPGTDEGADGQERGHRAGGLERRLRGQAPAAGRCRARGADGRSDRVLQDADARPARHHRQLRRRRFGGAASGCRAAGRRRSLSGGRGGQGHGDILRHRQWRVGGLRVLAGRRLRVGRLARLRPQEDGHHGARRLGVGQAAFPRDRAWTARRRTSPASASATCRATCSATACCCRAHTNLVGAFNHLHIFCDPDPDPEVSFEERRRLFDLPRSSWTDYNAELLSPGGAIFDRKAKSMKLTPEIQARFGLTREKVTPAELMQAMLRAEIDLLWFGGIGTFIKATEETHAEVGDKANDATRIDGREVRAKVVGEGANLGVTQRGRIE